MTIDFTKFTIFTVFLVAFFAKVYLSISLVNKGMKNPVFFNKFLLFSGALLCAAFSDLTWVITYGRVLFFPKISTCIIYFFIRIAWPLCLIQYQSLGIFIEKLSEVKQYSLPKHQKVILFFNSCYIIYFTSLAFFYCMSKERFWLEIQLMKYGAFIGCILLFSIFFALKKINKENYSKILKQQLITLLKYIICPLISLELLLGIFALILSDTHSIIAAILTILYTYAGYWVFKIMRLRFLNFNNDIRASHKFPFFKKFRQAIAHLGNASHIEQLEPIAQMAFKTILDIEPNHIHLYFRQSNAIKNLENSKKSVLDPAVEQIVEQVILDNQKIITFMREQRIIMYDEIIFNNINNKTELNTRLITFLDALNADVFIPMYRNNTLISFVIIERNARKNLLFSDIECDEMILYAASLENVINIFQNNNLEIVVEREKKLQEELFLKHQEINQFRESLETFHKSDKQNKIGIFSYTSYNTFVYLNQDIKDIITIDLNAYKGHRLTKEFQEIASEVLRYKTTKTTYTWDERGAKIIVRAVPILGKSNVLLTVYYPHVFDFIQQAQACLGKPTEIDYLLYLETTQAGQLINKLLPSSSPSLIDFKINLLKLALSKRALLIDVPDEDLETVVHILHKISLRETLKSLKIGSETDMYLLAKNLFGINTMYESASETKREKPLLESLHNTGTLFIHNIHLLSLEIQEMLAEYIKYGYYRIYKSDQRIASSVRILCSSRQNLAQSVQENKFSKALFHELNQAYLRMPSLAELTSEEYQALIESFSEQTLTTSCIKDLLKFTDSEIKKLSNDKPLSLKELKLKIELMLKKKSEHKDMSLKNMHFDVVQGFEEPEFSQAAQLGKKALKDPKILEMLIKRFKSQTKVAEFLGVDRSAVYKRLKRFDLL